MHPLLNIALRAARDAAEAIAHSSDRLDRVKIIDASAEGFLTSMDQTADKTLVYHLENAHPEHGIDSRVSGIKKGENKDIVWLIDPVVGNKNFARGYTQFAVSMACQIEGIIQHAVIINPLLQEEYTATRGSGAQLNARKLRVSTSSELNNAYVGLNPENLDIAVVTAMQQKLHALQCTPRITGCTALDMLQVAADRLQAGWSATEPGHSLAAANLILKESGGLLGSETGNPDFSSNNEILFANPRLFKQIVQIRQQLAG